MTNMNANIILAQRQPNILGSWARGQAIGRQANEIQRENALSTLYKEQGAGLLSGDPGALNALAQYDPNAALQIQNVHDQRKEREERLKLAKAAAGRAARSLAENLSDRDRKLHREKLKRLARDARLARNQDDLNLTLSRYGLAENSVNYEDLDTELAKMVGVYEVLAIDKDIADLRDEPSEPAVEKEISLLSELGYSREEAIQILKINRTSRDPVTGETVIINRATGEQIGGPSKADDPVPQSGVGNLDFGPRFSDSDSSFGLEGFGKKVVNRAADVVGAEVPFPSTQDTQRDFDVLQESLVNTLSGGYDRQPPSWLLRNIHELTPESGRLWAGPTEAQSKLQSLGRNLKSEVQSVTKQLKRRMSPNNRAKLESQKSALEAALLQVDQAYRSFEADSGATQTGNGGTTSSGLGWRYAE